MCCLKLNREFLEEETALPALNQEPVPEKSCSHIHRRDSCPCSSNYCQNCSSVGFVIPFFDQSLSLVSAAEDRLSMSSIICQHLKGREGALPVELSCCSASPRAVKPLIGGMLPMPTLSSLALRVGFEAMPAPPQAPHCML